MLLKLRKWLKLADDQPSDHVPTDIKAPDMQPLSKDEMISLAEEAEHARQALGSYQGHPDLALASEAAKALFGDLLPGKETKNIHVQVDYTDDVPHVLVHREGKFRAFVNEDDNGIYVTFEKVFTETPADPAIFKEEK